MKRINGIIFILFSFSLMGNALFAQPSDKWYLGEWTDGKETIVITENKFINSTEGIESAVFFYEEPDGRITIIPEYCENDGGFADFYYMANSQTKQIFSVIAAYEDEDAKIKSVFNRVGTRDDSNMSGTGSDRAWKSAFDSNGYLVLKSEHQYTKLGRTSYFYVVLKGYGDNYKRGKVTVHFGGFIENVGIYDYDDGALIYPEFYTATGYPADGTAIEGRLFNVEFSPTISITEYTEPGYGGAVTAIKYRQTNSGDLSAYKQSSNPHPRHWK